MKQRKLVEHNLNSALSRNHLKTLCNKVCKLQTMHMLSKFCGFIINSLRKFLCNAIQLEHKIQQFVFFIQSGFIPFKKKSQD